MDNQFVPFEISKSLHDHGFKEPCFGWKFVDGSSPNVHIENAHNKFHLPMPLWQQAIDFLEKKLEMCFMVYYNQNNGKWGYALYSFDERIDIRIEDTDEKSRLYGNGTHKTKEEAIISGIKEGIKLIKC